MMEISLPGGGSVKLSTPRLMRIGSLPRWHGNRFIQLYLNKEETARLHIWHPKFEAKQVENAQIHDHEFDLESTILHGRLLHEVWQFDELDPVKEAGPNVYSINTSLFGISTALSTKHKEGKRTAPEAESDHFSQPKKYRGKVLMDNEFMQGSVYTFPHGIFHRTENRNNGPTITLMLKTWEDPAIHARVAHPYGEVPDHAFEGGPSEDSMWEVIDEACHIMSLPPEGFPVLVPELTD